MDYSPVIGCLGMWIGKGLILNLKDISLTIW